MTKETLVPRGYRRNKNELEYDRLRISELLLEGETIREITRIINEERGYQPELKHPTVQKDINKIREQWSTVTALNVQELKNRQLASLDRMERVLWSQWHRSCKDKTKSKNTVKGKPHQKEDENGNKAKPDITPFETQQVKETEARLGDPRYIAEILKIHERRARLLGLDAPSLSGIIGPDGEIQDTGFGRPAVLLPDNGRGPGSIPYRG